MDFQALFNKAKTQVISTGLFALGFISIFLPWASVCVYNVCFSASLSQYLGLWGTLILIASIAGLAASGYSVYMAYKNIVDQKKLMLTMLVNAISAGGSAIIGLIYMLGGTGGASWGIGFILFMIVMVAAAALNGMKVLADKDLAKQVMNEVKADAQKKTASMSQPSSTSEDKTPEEAPTTVK